MRVSKTDKGRLRAPFFILMVNNSKLIQLKKNGGCICEKGDGNYQTIQT